MSITSGNKIDDVDIAQLYTKLNSIISSYGGSISQLTTIPAQGALLENDNINNLTNKIEELKKDSYLGSNNDLFLSYSIINNGSKIIPEATITNLSTTILTNLQTIECRNTANNSNTQKSHGTKDNTSKGFTTKSNGFVDTVTNNFSSCFEACFGFGSKKSHGSNSHGTNSHGSKTNTYNTHGSVVDILNTHATNSNT